MILEIELDIKLRKFIQVLKLPIEKEKGDKNRWFADWDFPSRKWEERNISQQKILNEIRFFKNRAFKFPFLN